jgi:hypothetical protein
MPISVLGVFVLTNFTKVGFKQGLVCNVPKTSTWVIYVLRNFVAFFLTLLKILSIMS